MPNARDSSWVELCPCGIAWAFCQFRPHHVQPCKPSTPTAHSQPHAMTSDVSMLCIHAFFVWSQAMHSWAVCLVGLGLRVFIFGALQLSIYPFPGTHASTLVAMETPFSLTPKHVLVPSPHIMVPLEVESNTGSTAMGSTVDQPPADSSEWRFFNASEQLPLLGHMTALLARCGSADAALACSCVLCAIRCWHCLASNLSCRAVGSAAAGSAAITKTYNEPLCPPVKVSRKHCVDL